MSQPSLAAEDLIAWNDRTAGEWRKLLAEHPEVLALPCDIAKTRTVGELLQHVVAVELRYAQQLAGLPISEYADIPYDTVESIYSTHDRATALFRQLLSDSLDWEAKFDFVTRTLGRARSTRKAILFHSQLHSIRHYAQLATLVRQHGIQQKWRLDYLVMQIELLDPAAAS